MAIPDGSLTVAESRRLRSGHAAAQAVRVIRGIADMDDTRVSAQVKANAIHDSIESRRMAQLKLGTPRKPARARIPEVETVYKWKGSE